jgi:membrane-associated phospholipid phosphatase
MSPAVWRWAKLISQLANPMVLSLPCFAAVSYRASPHWSQRLRWWSIASLAMSLTPFAHVRWGVRTGRLSDHEVSVRQERFWPYMAELGAIGSSYLLMRVLGAPKLMTAMVLSVGLGVSTVTAVTLLWKVSMHVTGTAGTATLLVLIYGKRWIPVFLIVPAVGWSRHVLDHHTPSQIATGAAIGTLAPLMVFRAMHLLDQDRVAT